MPAKFDKLRLAIKSQLKKDNPKMKEKEAESRSFAIATAQAKKLGIPTSENFSKNENGEIVVAENVKVILDSNITAVGNIITE